MLLVTAIYCGIMSDGYRVCILFNGYETERWAKAAIEYLLSDDDVHVCFSVINTDAGFTGRSARIRARKYPAWALYRVVRVLVSPDNGYWNQSVPIREIAGLPDKFIECEPTDRNGLWHDLPASVVTRIESEADLVFRNGFDLLRGKVLKAPDDGVLSYHHGDPRKYRGGPAGFWEFLQGASSSGTMVQRLTPDLDAGGIMAYQDVSLDEANTWIDIKQQLYGASTRLLAAAVDRIRAGDGAVLTPTVLGPVYTPPNGAELLQYLAKELAGLWKNFYSS
jgi:folate-dependent phosphoribosylglycinamide formyltransferase PurN